MNKYAVIADDLTGAGDTGVQFSKAGLPTRILLDKWAESSLEGAVVVVAQTDSRAMS
ncbi:MAG: four-carbon acid sugar kinase family protein, partial [Deferribacteraceae bacterium]|nr:four-carbon acid sugar kinase family protein [Deferribacteraceae bacterium]